MRGCGARIGHLLQALWLSALAAFAAPLVAAGESVVLRATDLSGDGALRPALQVFRPDGGSIGAASGGTVATFDFVAAVPGTYTALVCDNSVGLAGACTGAKVGAYGLSFTSSVERFSYAALGDSYSSGEGVMPYRDLEDNTRPFAGCHRSTRAYPTLAARPDSLVPLSARTDWLFDFYACSGAVTDNVRADGEGQDDEPPQMAPATRSTPAATS